MSNPNSNTEGKVFTCKLKLGETFVAARIFNGRCVHWIPKINMMRKYQSYHGILVDMVNWCVEHGIDEIDVLSTGECYRAKVADMIDPTKSVLDTVGATRGFQTYWFLHKDHWQPIESYTFPKTGTEYIRLGEHYQSISV